MNAFMLCPALSSTSPSAFASCLEGHRKSGRLGILYTLAALTVIEIFAVDLVGRQRHHVAANVSLVAGAFSALWIVGFAHAIPLRPTLLDAATLSPRA